MATTSRGYRYPASTDFVKDGATNIQNLAEDINTDVGNIATTLGGLTDAWTTWTPALTASTSSPTLGTGSSATGYYNQMGKVVVYWARIQFGTSGEAAGSGDYRVSLPVTAVARSGAVFGQGFLYDDTASTAALCVARYQSTTTVDLIIGSATEVVTDANPWTWAANDYITISGTYEAA